MAASIGGREVARTGVGRLGSLVGRGTAATGVEAVDGASVDGPTTGDGTRRSGAQAIERAMTVLRCFDDEVDGLTLSELAHRTGIAISTTHRILRAMCRAGFLDQDPRTERYFLARATAILGQVAARNLGFEDAQARLERLSVEAHESTSLGIHDGHDVVVLLRTQAAHRQRFDRPQGTRVWMHASAMGKALLAFPRRGDLQASLAALPDLPAFTEHTITRRRALLAELEAIRERGYAVNDREQDLGIRAVGAPILGPEGWAHAAVAVQGPVARVDDARVEALGTIVVAAARDLAGVLQLSRLPPAPDSSAAPPFPRRGRPSGA
jgi:IclR family acetate operon transcriptional repressor